MGKLKDGDIREHFKKINEERGVLGDDWKDRVSEPYVVDTDRRKYFGHKPKFIK